MRIFLFNLLTCAAVMSCLSICFLLLSRSLKKVWSARRRGFVWWMLTIGFLLPIKPRLFPAPFTLHAASPSAPAYPAAPGAAGPVGEAGAAQASSFDPLLIFFGIWLFGALCTALYFFKRQNTFRRYVRRNARPCAEACRAAAAATAKTLGVPTPQVYVMPALSTPMLTGLFRPIILLPEQAFHTGELRLILKHELTHCKRRDLWLQLCFLFIRAVYWFNPLMPLLDKAMRTDCELACDEAVADGESLAAKKQYCSALLASACENSLLSPVLNGSLGCKKKQLKDRLWLILSGGKQRKLGFLSALIGAAVALSGTLFSFPAPAAAPPKRLVETTTVVQVTEEDFSAVPAPTSPEDDVSGSDTETWVTMTTYPAPPTTEPEPETAAPDTHLVPTTVPAPKP